MYVRFVRLAAVYESAADCVSELIDSTAYCRPAAAVGKHETLVNRFVSFFLNYVKNDDIPCSI
jgi:hypothetical protein